MVIQSSLPSVKIPQIGIIQLLFSNPYHTPDDRKILIDATDTDKYLTYIQLKHSVLKFATTLQDMFNFKVGDVVAIYSPNQMDYSVPLLGTVAAGGSVTPVSHVYSAKELAYQLDMTHAKVLIAHPSNIENALAAAELVGLDKSKVFVFGHDVVLDTVIPYTKVFLSDGTRVADPVSFNEKEVNDQVAYLCFSSGTTGTSKGVMTTHTNMVSNILQYHAIEHPFLDSNRDRVAGVIPFFHILGLTILLHFSLFMGLPLYVMPKFDLSQFCKTVQQEKITYSILVPPIVLMLAKDPIVKDYNVSSLKAAMCGAAPLGPELMQEVRKSVPTLTVKQGYGMTETSPCVSVEPTDCVVDGSIGLLLPNMTAKIVNDEGQGSLEVDTGERGELWLKGPNIMKGYINNAGATSDSIDKDGYLHTGDVVMQDKNGYLFIVDRIKELIKYKGFQVPPAELEAILLASPLVMDCAVIGVYDSLQATELPRGYITLKPSIPATEETAKTIKEFVAGQVVYYKQLRSIVFVDEIPKSASGKILRRILRDAANTETKDKKQGSKL